MACTVDVVVKFGGSAITVKDQLETLQPHVLVQAAKLIRSCCDKQLTCIVVHGAGSFGHHHAKLYNVHKGWSALAEDGEAVKLMKSGFSRVRQSVTKLHTLVQDSLLEEDVPVVGVSCCGVWQTDGGIVVEHNMAAIKDLVMAGFVPVLHGDCVLDRQMGCTILSGDTIIQTICEESSVGHVVFLTSVNGVYSKSPETHQDVRVAFVTSVDPDQTGSNSPSDQDAVLYRTILVDRASRIRSSTSIISSITSSEGSNTQSCDSSSEGSNTRSCDTSSKGSNTQSCDTSSKGSNTRSCDTSSDGANTQSPDTNTEGCSTQSPDTNTEITGGDTHSGDNRTQNNTHDVTGGMSLKFSTALNIVRSSEGRTCVFVCKAGATGATSACLYGQFDEGDKHGTVIRFEA